MPLLLMGLWPGAGLAQQPPPLANGLEQVFLQSFDISVPEDSAIIIRQQLVQQAPGTPHAQYCQAWLLWQRAQYKQAQPLADSLAARWPGWGRAQALRGQVLESRDLLDEAYEAMDAACTASPRDPFVFFARGAFRSRLGSLDAALRDYDTALRLDTACVAALYNRAILHIRQEAYDAAQTDIATCQRLRPGQHFHYLPSCLLAYQLRNYEQGARDCSFHLYRFPKHGLAYLARGLCYMQLGAMQLACDDWGQALRLGEPEARLPLKENCR